MTSKQTAVSYPQGETVKGLWKNLVDWARNAAVWMHLHPRLSAGIAAAIVLIPSAIWLIVHLRRPSAEELERRRREHLAAHGRITDGEITDAATLSGEEADLTADSAPEVLFFNYRLAGVTYSAAQDVSALPDLVRGVRLDQPIQVRYDPRNPGNSIVVAESWSGLWL